MMKKLCCVKTSSALVVALALAIFLGAAVAWAEPWKFGVMSDTQWPTSPDGKNPNAAVNVINHINKKFIDEKVKFVIQVGDLTDKPSTVVANPARVENLDIRATFAQDLYNAGIGFYPLRGNHEDKPSNPGGTLPADFYGSYAREFQRIFPQTQTGINNLTPVDAMISTTMYGPQSNTYNQPLILGTNFASEPSMSGLTYSFDYDNARFVLIDQFTKPDGTAHSNLDQKDIDWVGTQLSTRSASTHAFVFAHKGLITENHNDNLFNSSNPIASQASKDLMESYMQYLQTNGVRYHMGGHDHMHNRAIITSPNSGNYKVQNLIAASDSYKFYIPPAMSTFNTQPWRSLEQPIAQELFTVGYYIFTVDGPKVTVDYYAMPNGCNGDCDQTNDIIPYSDNGINPVVPFNKHETFGYSLNGKEILVPQGGSYSLVDDTSKAVVNGGTGYLGTKAAILSGTNGSTGKDFNGRSLTKTVNTGWTSRIEAADLDCNSHHKWAWPFKKSHKAKDNEMPASDMLTLWGMADSLATKLDPSAAAPQYNYEYVVPNTSLTETYVLSMTYKPGHSEHLGNGGFGIATKDADGNWINAIDNNVGGTKKFVRGPWKTGYALGAYGVDTKAKTAWAVINHNGDFAVAEFDDHEDEDDHGRERHDH
jgi:hypothetical protein